jgi:hypothetical protein
MNQPLSPRHTEPPTAAVGLRRAELLRNKNSGRPLVGTKPSRRCSGCRNRRLDKTEPAPSGKSTIPSPNQVIDSDPSARDHVQG